MILLLKPTHDIIYKRLSMEKNKIQYYDSYEDDFVESKNQNYPLPNNYKWINHNFFYKVIANILYMVFIVISFIYCKLILRVSFRNKKVLKNYANYFLYANHTQAIGDAFIPYILSFPKKPYTIVSTANLGIPIIGKLLPFLGALPIPDNIHQKKEFLDAVNILCQKHPIIIYPEAHLWPWCTFIRDYSTSSFTFPIDNNIPTFVMTTTYQKRKFFKKPVLINYIDGPFYPNSNLSRKDKKVDLRNKVYECMQERSKNSNYDYIKYQKRNN